jgi:lysine 2,3-aminomutase
VDLPGGGGKVPILPEYVLKKSATELLVRNYRGDQHLYPLYNG